MEIPFLSIFFLVGNVNANTPGYSTKSPKGFHCGNITKLTKQQNGSYGCVPCFFPQNCLENNVCYIGTGGLTCEKCWESGDLGTFYRVGNSCLSCLGVPWPAICLGVVVLLLIYAICMRGFSVSVNTKFKLVCHFVQILALSMRVKIHWPENILRMIGVLNFADFNSNIVTPGCLFSNLTQILSHYTEGLTSLGVPFLLLMCICCITRRDTIKKKKIGEDKDRPKNGRRTSFCRFVFMTWLLIYTPVALWSIHTYSCSGAFPYQMVLDQSREIFLYDQTQACEGWVYQFMQFIAVSFLIFYVVLGPLMLALVTLRQRKWFLLETEKNTYGPAYESFKAKWCFWEALPLLRKGVSIMVTDTLPFNPLHQTIILLSMSAFYTLLLMLSRPYRKCYWKKSPFNHTFFDILSNVCICLLQSIGLVLTLGLYVKWLDYVLIILVSIVLMIWVVGVLITPLETQTEGEDTYPGDKETDTEGIGLKSTGSAMKRKNKVGAIEISASLHERQRNLDF